MCFCPPTTQTNDALNERPVNEGMKGRGILGTARDFVLGGETAEGRFDYSLPHSSVPNLHPAMVHYSNMCYTVFCGTDLSVVYAQSILYSPYYHRTEPCCSSGICIRGYIVGLSKSRLMATFPLQITHPIMDFSQLWLMRNEEKSAGWIPSRING